MESVNLNGVIFDAEDAAVMQAYAISIDSCGYPAATVGGRHTRLHRILSNAGPGDIVDHINRVKTDLRRGNLRLTNRHGNARNCVRRSHNTSGFKGVHKCSSTGRWRAEIRVNGKGVKLGRFDDIKAAAIAYDAAATRLHGDFAVTNKSLGLLT